MSITNGPNLGLMVNGNAGEGHYSQFMAFLRGIDGLVMPSVKGYLTNTPPASPADGDCYIIGAAPTGAWAGQGGKVARYSTIAVAWEYYTPKNGWMLEANSARESYRFTSGAWEIFYQQGTWVSSIIGSGGGGTFTLATAAGDYTKNGRVVTAMFRCVVSSITGTPSGSAQIGGLPFTAGAYNSFGYGVTGRVAGVTFPSGYTQLNIYVPAGNAYAALYTVGSNQPIGALSAAGISATAEISGQVIYHI